MNTQPTCRIGLLFGIRRAMTWGGLALIAPWFLAGCGIVFPRPFVPGSYVGEIPCTFQIEDESGNSEEEEFTSAITLIVEEGGGFLIDGVELAVGQEIVRSIPTADLAFEISAIEQRPGYLRVTYTPRPTLPGITVDGELAETYRVLRESVLAVALAELVLTDVSTTTTLTIACSGPLSGE